MPIYRRSPLTLIFVVLLVVSYATTSYSSHFLEPTPSMVLQGMFYPPAVEAGQWWRFITATLMHGNPAHLLNNLFGILAFGSLLEPVIGSALLLSLYALSVFLGLALSAFMQPHTPVLGASTIDYGLIGAYLTMSLKLRLKMDQKLFLGELRSAVFFVVVFVFWNWSQQTTISLWGHVGGLSAGILFGLFLPD